MKILTVQICFLTGSSAPVWTLDWPGRLGWPNVLSRPIEVTAIFSLLTVAFGSHILQYLSPLSSRRKNINGIRGDCTSISTQVLFWSDMDTWGLYKYPGIITASSNGLNSFSGLTLHFYGYMLEAIRLKVICIGIVMVWWYPNYHVLVLFVCLLISMSYVLLCGHHSITCQLFSLSVLLLVSSWVNLYCRWDTQIV